VAPILESPQQTTVEAALDASGTQDRAIRTDSEMVHFLPIKVIVIISCSQYLNSVKAGFSKSKNEDTCKENSFAAYVLTILRVFETMAFRFVEEIMKRLLFAERLRATKQWWAMGVLIAACALGAKGAITHRYSFNDGTANDSVGTAHGAQVNGASVSGGRLVLANDGVQTNASTGQYVSLPANILQTRNFTLAVWFSYGGGNAWQRIIDFGNSGPDPAYGMAGQGFIILANTGSRIIGQFSLNSAGGTPTDAVNGTAFPVGGQHFLAYVHNLDMGQELLYLDGQRVGLSTASIDPTTANYTNFWIGRSQFSQDPFYNGSLDELRTYDQALSAAEILAAYNAGPDVLIAPVPATVNVGVTGTNVVLTWSSDISGNLQSSTNLSNASSWVNVTNRVTSTGADCTVTLNGLLPQQFFRLRQ
jgi:hypothetical protein